MTLLPQYRSMKLDEVYQELQLHDVPLEDLDASSLHSILDVLERARSERVVHEQKQAEAREREAHLVESIRSLSSQNAVLHARLLASLDSLDVVHYRNQALQDNPGEKDALLMLNESLSVRLRESQAELARVKEALAAANEPVRFANDRNATRASMQRMTPIQPSVTNRFQPTQQDSSEDSDTPTEVQYEYQGSPRPPSRRSISREARAPVVQQALRTKTIVLELTNELEVARKRCDYTERQKEESNALLQAHLQSRDRELATVYAQLDHFLGLEGLTVRKSLAQSDDRYVRHIASDAPALDSSVFSALNRQVAQLRHDIERLQHERDNLLVQPHQGLAPSQMQEPGSELGDIQELSVQLQSAQSEVVSLRSQLAAQDDEFDSLASQVSIKLANQKERIEHADSTIQALHQALHDTEQLASDANQALAGEKSRREWAEEALLSRSGAMATTELDRPRSALASPNSGERFYRTGMPTLGLARPRRAVSVSSSGF